MALEFEKNKDIQLPSFECECENDKKYRLKFDGDDSGNYEVKYCQKCYDQDDKQFMISTEVLF